MKLKNIYIILFLLFFTKNYGQKKEKVFNAEGENAIYKKEWSVGVRFHTNAFSAFYEQVWIKDIKKRHLFQAGIFAFSDLRDKKVESIIRDVQNQKYFFGKKNDFYAIQLLYGNRTVIANKSEVDGVRFSLAYYGGLSLGVLKPYYLEFLEIKDGEQFFHQERYSDENKDKFLNKQPNFEILGEGSFTKGFENLSFTPALITKLGLNFDFARKSNLVTSLEVGAELDIFYKKVDIYISDSNKMYILNLYLSMQIGRRN